MLTDAPNALICGRKFSHTPHTHPSPREWVNDHYTPKFRWGGWNLPAPKKSSERIIFEPCKGVEEKVDKVGEMGKKLANHFAECGEKTFPKTMSLSDAGLIWVYAPFNNQSVFFSSHHHHRHTSNIQPTVVCMWCGVFGAGNRKIGKLSLKQQKK